MLQYIIVLLIGIAVVIYILNKLFRCFFDKKHRSNHCDSCPGCILNPKNKSNPGKKNKLDKDNT